MKLCLVANPNLSHTRRWVNYFHNQGMEIHLIGEHAPVQAPPSDCYFYDLTRTTNLRKVRYIAWTRTIRQLIRRINPDILHAISVTSAGWLGAAAGYHPFIVTAIGSDLMLLNERPILNRRLSIWALRQADYVTCQSEGLAQKARRYGADSNKIEVIYFGIDLDTFQPKNEDGSTRLIPGNETVILSLRSLQPVYQPLDIAHAIPIVLKHVPKVIFAVFTYNSDPTILAGFKSILENAGVDEKVHYIAPQGDDRQIAAYYQMADIAVSVPSSDGTPSSVLEAMACGTAVIASDLPALKDWITPGENGLLVPVGDIQALADAMIRLVQDEQLRNSLGVHAADKIRKAGDRNYWMQRMMEIYHTLGGLYSQS